jgi:hypothetical protein
MKCSIIKIININITIFYIHQSQPSKFQNQNVVTSRQSNSPLTKRPIRFRDEFIDNRGEEINGSLKVKNQKGNIQC